MHNWPFNDAHKGDALLMAMTITPFMGLLGGRALPFLVLLGLMSLDFFTGVIAAAINGRLASEPAWKGALKKLLAVSGVAMTWMLDVLLSTGIATTLPGDQGAIDRFLTDAITRVGFSTVTAVYFCFAEGISILENLQEGGVTMPAFLKKFLSAGKQAADAGGVPR